MPHRKSQRQAEQRSVNRIARRAGEEPQQLEFLDPRVEKFGPSGRDPDGTLWVPGSEHEGWTEGPAYAGEYVIQLARDKKTQLAHRGIGGALSRYDNPIQGGSNAAWEWSQQNPQGAATALGMGPEMFGGAWQPLPEPRRY